MNEAIEQEFDFYRGAGRGDVLDQLTHLAAWARSLVMLTGPLGAGKSVLLEEVVSRVEQSGRTLVVRPPVGFLSTGHEMMRHVAADLGAKVADGLDVAALQRIVMQHIVAELANDRSTLLLLDDAHELSADVLRTVAALVDEAKDSRALNVLVAGEPSLPEQLRKATPARDNWHEIRLRPFALNDVRAFLRQRLPQSAASLDSAGMQALARKSGGWPGRILGAFDGQPRRRRLFTRRIPLLHVGWLAALSVALGVVVWMQQRPDEPPAPVSTTTVETLALPGTATQEVEATNGSGVRLAIPGGPGAPKPVDPRSLLPPSQRIPVPKPPDELTMPAPPPAPVIKVPGSTTPPPPPPQATPFPANAVASVPAATPARPAMPTRIALPKPEPSPPEPAAPAVAARPAAEPAPAAPSRSVGGGDNGWLNEQPPANFTVQIMGVSAASAAQGYVRQHPGAGMRIVRTMRNGREWYVVVKGSYRGRAEAQAAMKDVGGGGVQPWVRTFDGIQRDTRGQ